jgi:hypothetical protein
MQFTQNYPRMVAAVGFLIGLSGMVVSLPLFHSIRLSLFFFLGASAWIFLLWRALSVEYRPIFKAGWMWSMVLHFGLLPISPLISGFLGTKIPVAVLILVMGVLSVFGLIADMRLGLRGETPDQGTGEQG